MFKYTSKNCQETMPRLSQVPVSVHPIQCVPQLQEGKSPSGARPQESLSNKVALNSLDREAYESMLFTLEEDGG